MSSSKDRERDRAPEPHNKSAAQDVLDEWMNWRERMRAIDQQYQEQAARAKQQEKFEKVNNRLRDNAPDHIPTKAETALHSSRHDESDEFGDHSGSRATPRENKTAQQLYNATGEWIAGRSSRTGRTVGQKPVSGVANEEYVLGNPVSGKRYAYNYTGNRGTASKRVNTVLEEY